MKKFFTVIIVMILTVFLASCGDNDTKDSAASGDVSKITVVLNIDFPDDCGIEDIDDLKLAVPDGSSVLDILEIWAGDENTVTLDPSSENPYVTGINGISAGGSTGWIYEVNEEMVMDPADEYKVKNGDEISWEYEDWSE